MDVRRSSAVLAEALNGVVGMRALTLNVVSRCHLPDSVAVAHDVLSLADS